MQYKADTPASYVEELEKDWRKDKLLQVRNMILQSGSTLHEGIEYKMLSYGNAKKTLFHLNAQKGYVSLYVGNISKIENAHELLQGFDRGKGCIRIKKTTKLSETRLSEFINTAIEHWRAGGDTDC